GPRAAHPVHYEDIDWAAERWTRGCSMAHMAPGSSPSSAPRCGRRSRASTGPAPRRRRCRTARSTAPSGRESGPPPRCWPPTDAPRTTPASGPSTRPSDRVTTVRRMLGRLRDLRAHAAAWWRRSHADPSKRDFRRIGLLAFGVVGASVVLARLTQDTAAAGAIRALAITLFALAAIALLGVVILMGEEGVGGMGASDPLRAD